MDSGRTEALIRLRAVILRTLPVMAGYLFLGFAFGVALREKGLGWPWALYMSACIYAGSMQFALLDVISAPFSPLTAALLTLMVNARHIFYGFTMLEPYSRIGKYRYYNIFALTDETYSLVCTGAPAGVQPGRWYTAISAMDQLYWVTGSLLGSLIGQLLPAAWTRGIDFAMTALFAVIATEQTADALRAARQRRSMGEKAAPALREALLPLGMGLGLTLICLLIWGSETFLLYTMAAMTLCFVVWYSLGEGRKQA